MSHNLIIMGGLPGAGKSFVREKLFSDYIVVDSDDIKKTLKGYNPKKPHIVHEESKVLEKALIYKYMSEKKSFVYDTTSSNVDKVLSMIRQAKMLGYKVNFVYVNVPLNIALERNKKRERVVNENIIYEKYEIMSNSIRVIKKYVDEFTQVDNY